MARVPVLRKGGQTPLVDPCLNVTVTNAFEVDHRRCDVAMPHPLLQRADVDPVLKVPCRVGMTELVQKPAGAVGASGAAVDLDSGVVEFMCHAAMAAVELRAVRNGFELF